MVPGEYRVKPGKIELNAGRKSCEIRVTNLGDRPVQVGSHFHFFEVNRQLQFSREVAFGMRLDIPAGTAVRFEPGEEKPVPLTGLGGSKLSFGLNGLSNGPVEAGAMPDVIRKRISEWEGFGE
ncbi:urease subunit beta [Paenibacillus sp. URB8-2]|uniref:urease subunit beta n=1 Tax=Paenibacillus sp. URB8-2 TaxID=2741301 RepID=UPI0015BF283B|nr:urease subunit beta [Paenibacillus sp. URB8-2]BCG57070.1 hypothetical protein PUR_04950 [Paenibacillus sp. URB8-2]